jgi:hypothetical protein
MQGHLSTLKANLVKTACASLLTFMTTASSLTGARTNTATYTATVFA